MRPWMLIAMLAAGCGDKETCEPSEEECNNIDDDCDGAVDEGLASSRWYADRDEDGYGTEFSSVSACAQPDGYTDLAGDCDDTRADVSPLVEEICDGVDNDCDGLLDASDGTLSDGVVGYLDADGDGLGSPEGFSFCELPDGFVAETGDCDDFDATITTSASWYLDSDGDGYGDAQSPAEVCTDPGEGYSADSTDCDDSDATINPGASEICGDGVDNNCDAESTGCRDISGNIDISDADASVSGYSNDHGRWLSSADFDGDGVDELVTADISGAEGLGAIYIFPPLAAGDSLVTGDAPGVVYGQSDDLIGYSGQAVPDLTGDGVPDLVTLFSSYAAVIAGPLDGGFTIEDGTTARINTGMSSLSSDTTQLAAGDFDGDGQADLVIGDPYYSDEYSYSGQAWLLPGPIEDVDLSSLTDGAHITGEGSIYGYLGITVSSAGDVDGDGTAEVLLGANRSSSAGYSYGGRVHLIDGDRLSSSATIDDAAAYFYGTSSNGYFGQDADSAGDVDGDGYDDVVIGAYNQGYSGKAYLFLGGSFSGAIADTQADASWSTSSANAYLGWRVAGAGDLDDDGFDDVLISEMLSSYKTSYGGSVMLSYGPLAGNITSESADAVLYSSQSYLYVGADIAGVGDVNGDGAPDIAVGAYSGSDVFVLFGGGGF